MIFLVVVFTLLLWIIENKISSKSIRNFLKGSLIGIYVVVLLWRYLDENIPRIKEFGIAIIAEDVFVYGTMIFIFCFREPLKRAVKAFLKKYRGNDSHLE